MSYKQCSMKTMSNTQWNHIKNIYVNAGKEWTMEFWVGNTNIIIVFSGRVETEEIISEATAFWRELWL